ncbi:ABC transporter permease [Kocuria rosea]|jgi:NitT/TauT family transport system permease protein|uniref:ABC transporter permease n=1 Tax=Kocuria rosea TaxID=1275 RepID=UPI00119D3F9B|nr:ABC transporter permease [Kocuria rosea]MEB2527987.1 ABC transporter permease [Kocuria rosea]MEB2617103.1 ABC transporter permease [Kocuria rosea]
MSAPHPAPHDTPQDTPRSPTDLDDAARGAPAGTGPAGPAPARTTRRTGSRWTGPAWGAFGVLVTIAVWWAFTHAAAGANTMIASFQPERMPGAVASLAERGVVVQDGLTSLWRLLCGLAVATGLGVPLGLLIGSYRRFRWTSAPVVQFLRMVSPLSWAPVAVALLGVGNAPVVFLVAAAAVWPITMNTAAGVKALDPLHLRVAETLGATPVERLRTVVLPSIRPFVMTGVRLALGISWVVIVPAEMLGVSSGLGYEILNARDRLAYDEMLVVILVIGLLGMALDQLAQWLLREPGPRR